MLGRMPMQIPSYDVRDYKIFFGNQYVADAKWSEFKDLGYGYGLFSYLQSFKFFNL